MKASELAPAWGVKPERYESDGKWYVHIPHTTYGDYTGDTVTRANFNVARDEFDNVTVLTFMYCTEAAAFHVDADVSEYDAERIAALLDYPVLDEEAMYEVEEELLDEALADDGYITRDTIHELAKRGIDASPEDVRCKVRDGLRAETLAANFESATSVHITEAAILALWG